MSPESTGHIKVKTLTWLAILDAIEASGLDLVAVGDGATVRISQDSAFEPDALVYAGPELPGNEMIVPEPIIVVEVISATSGSRDSGSKLRGYFSVPSVLHYLVVDPAEETVVHHRRRGGPEFATKLIEAGETLDLTPMGLTLEVRRFFRRR